MFQVRYTPENFGYTILFTNQKELFPAYPFRAPLSDSRKHRPVSLICTGKNEAQTVQEWMDCIFQQTRMPDEIVIVDGGSTDGSQELLTSLAKKSPVPIQVICKPGCNIAQGRNVAIEMARFSIIAATDFGCRPEKEWLENLLAPFEQDDQIEVVGGWYVAQDRKGNPIQRPAWPTLDQVDPATFIPSSRSVAFTKDLWRKAHGYPEWLTLTGEDTYFALELRRFSKRRAFVPHAIVRWLAPENIKSYWKKIYYWSIGDGESGVHSWLYWEMARRFIMLGLFLTSGLVLLLLSVLTSFTPLWVITSLFWIAGILGGLFLFKRAGHSPKTFLIETGTKISQISGFVKGALRRKTIDLRRIEKTKGFYFILAGVPLHDTGGGSRGAQIALELLRQNYTVVYIHKFDTYESVDLKIELAHPNLFISSLSQFSWDKFTQRFGKLISTQPCNVLIEFPLAEFIPLIQQLQSVNAVIAYDLLDDWDTQLGSTWYKESVEEQVIHSSHTLIATAPILEERLKKRTSKPITLLPNAVNLRLFEFQNKYPKPVDLPKEKLIITYIGALWGEWFDWDLLMAIAEAFPQAAVMVIGDYRGQCPEHFPNLYFLGLKPQVALPAYLAYTQVTIIPWKENKITYATSPLKLYEYLAMHTPVVIPNLPLLKDLPGVYISNGREEFLQNIEVASQNPVDHAEIKLFILSHSWEHRVNALIGLMNANRVPVITP